MRREIIRIDEEKCDGCGDCVSACAEGAIRVVDGKARLVSEVYCDGLGACLGHCPQGAIAIETVEARPFDAAAVERHLRAMAATTGGAKAAPSAPAPTRLPTHGSGPVPAIAHALPHADARPSGCPGSRATAWSAAPSAAGASEADGASPRPSELRQWPVQLHLVSPMASCFQGADVLLAADCTAFAVGDFHRDHLRGRALAIACPKLDERQEVYLGKLVSLLDDARIRSLSVMVMEVPCCSGLVRLAREAAARARRPVPIRVVVVGIQGDILHDAVA
jgi:Pyruvate/2-oxoacid:ferredoxin oxidoreductase delta subunit